MGYVWMAELPLADGRRADLCALGEKGDIIIVEVKSCREDLLSDRKWSEYRAWCDRFYFAVDPDFPLKCLPEDVGIVVADGFDGEMLRPAPEHPLAPARRRALLLRFARTAARRLARLQEDDQPGFS